MKRSSDYLEELGRMSLLDYACIALSIAGIAIVVIVTIYMFATGDTL